MDNIISVLILISHFFSFTIHSLTHQIVIPERRSSFNRTLIYRIETLNRRFDLSLIPSQIFLSSSLSWIDQKEINDCFYRGYVNEDFSSIVSISTCDGLFGTFIYDHVEYFIEPKRNENDTRWNFEHLLFTDMIDRCPVEGKPYLEEKQSRHYTRKKRQADLDPSAKHVEILVAYDDSLRDFHSDIEVRSYILTLFNYVSHLYSDASIGNNIKIWVVKLVELGSEASNYLQSSNDAGDILSKFCQWQRDNNHPGTYDAGVLLTRIRLCNKRTSQSMESKCDTLGLTELGTMCNLTSSCAVVRDTGFATAFTIAHEIAHLFGIRHDSDQVCLKWNKEQNLMATSLLFNHNHYKWSNCSRFYFTQYFESNRFPCVNNLPTKRSLLSQDSNDVIQDLPGYFSDLNLQCRRAFGIDFEYCKDLSHGPKCSRLYCREKFSSTAPCITNHAHWSDGSLCSNAGMEMKRCFRGQCRNIENLKPIHGNWSEWQPWSTCTRTCGSAVKKSRRFCDNPKPEFGGKYCSGASTRLESCDDNPPCENSLDTSRQLQCARYNNRSISSILPSGVQFEPKYNVLSNERCKLICKVSDDPLERSFIFNDRVDDGTPCSQDDDGQDICLQGVCVSFGCDYKYGSNATEDMCGVCNGHNQTCQLIHGRKIISQTGITDIIQIPLHTTRVRITQISSRKDRYYLAVKDINGTYLLNGLHHLQLYPMKFRLHNLTLSYTGVESSNETISMIGRLTLPIDIQMISFDPLETISTEVDWEYYAPRNEETEECSRPCQGVKTMKRCRINGKDYDLNYCSMFNIPFEYSHERCNGHCVLNWTRTDQQSCSTRCGDGFKHVLYQCARKGFHLEVIDEEICRRYLGEKPKGIIPCFGNCTGTGWMYGKWSECFDNGACIRKRSAECRNSSNSLVANTRCYSEFLFDTEQCPQTVCAQSRSIICSSECSAPYWQTFAWQRCTATCSSLHGFRHRRVVCFYNGSSVSDNNCDRRSKPVTKQLCTMNVTCAKWFVSHWSSCSVTCGIGIQHRRVLCKNQDVVVSSNECDKLKKPRILRRCQKKACEKTVPIWLVDTWAKCDLRSCLQTRIVRCVDSIAGGNLSISDCIKNRMQPLTKRICPVSNCLEWRVAHWHGCPVKCGLGIEFGSGYSCYTGQIPIRRLNTNQCQAVQPPLNKPELRRICRRHCPDWRSNDLTKMTMNSTSSKYSFSLVHFSIFIGIQLTHSFSDYLD